MRIQHEPFFGPSHFTLWLLALPLSPDRPLVERQLLTLKDIPINPSALTGPAAHNSIQSTRLELPLQRRLDLAHLLHALLLLILDALALRLLLRLLALGLSSPAEASAVVSLVPRAEGRSVDLDDGRLGEGVGSDELVVGRVEGDDDDTHFARDALGAPGEVARVETQRAVFGVAAADPDEMYALVADTGVGWLTTLLESSVNSM